MIVFLCVRTMFGGLTMDFVALDVELANTNLCSICQIGIVRYENGALVEKYCTIIDPQDEFFGMGIRKHSIRSEDVIGKPKFSEIIKPLQSFLNGRVCISHGGLDKSAIEQACALWELPKPQCIWINSATVVRHTWDQFKKKGYSLESIAEHLEIEYQAHDALEDANTAARVMLAAIEKSGLGIEAWHEKLSKIGSDNPWPKHETGDGNPDGLFAGNEIVFTGLSKGVENTFANIAQELGFNVWDSVRAKTTTHLCHSDELPRSTVRTGKDKTRKHAAAIKLNEKGKRIEIMSETEFRQRFLQES